MNTKQWSKEDLQLFDQAHEMLQQAAAEARGNTEPNPDQERDLEKFLISQKAKEKDESSKM